MLQVGVISSHDKTYQADDRGGSALRRKPRDITGKLCRGVAFHNLLISRDPD